MKTLRLILGDQLNIQHSWFQEQTPNILYTLMEIKTESEYCTHHIQKVIGFFTAMRDFSSKLNEQGHQVKYFKITDDDNEQDFALNLNKLIREHKISKLEIIEPDEYRLEKYFQNYLEDINIDFEIFQAEHFLAERKELESMFGQKNKYLMESFYRKMRVKYNLLLDKQSKPLGGKWNYDTENRKKLPKKETIPESKLFNNDAKEVIADIKEAKLKYFGNYNDEFDFPINLEQSRDLLEYFCTKLLAKFGTYQDAMTDRDNFLFHSRLSFAMNTKIISPLEVIERSIAEFEKRPEEISLSQVEGFVRQILGWREFMRSFYWCKMPEFASTNFFDNQNKLPKFYWNGKTKMNCLKNCIQDSLDKAYAHHIQRLMITGNFALMAGVHPDQVDNWYLGIYIDALDWVEITNTRGMSQWADGGGLATKPYISSANYVNKMSDYCSSCHYNYKEKLGDKACPFNTLYWNFLHKHKDKLAKNMRMSMVYRVWDKFAPEEQDQILAQAKNHLSHLDDL